MRVNDLHYYAAVVKQENEIKRTKSDQIDKVSILNLIL